MRYGDRMRKIELALNPPQEDYSKCISIIRIKDWPKDQPPPILGGLSDSKRYKEWLKRHPKEASLAKEVKKELKKAIVS